MQILTGLSPAVHTAMEFVAVIVGLGVLMAVAALVAAIYIQRTRIMLKPVGDNRPIGWRRMRWPKRPEPFKPIYNKGDGAPARTDRLPYDHYTEPRQ